MPFERPTLTELKTRIQADVETRVTGGTILLRRAVLKVLATVFAGIAHIMYGYLDYKSKQLFATTADTEGLANIGDEYGLNRESATYATGSGTATGTNGAIIPAGSELESTDGNLYTVDTAATISGGTATIDFTASTANADSNDDAGITLTFVSPISGIDTEVTVDSDGITGGADEEEDDGYRERILLRKRQPPHGGAVFDYEKWALEVDGVTRAWAFGEYQGVGTVGVAFVRDDDDGSIIPDATERDEVEDYIIEHTDPASGETVGIPVTAEPGLFIIELTPLSINITVAIYPNTTAVQNAIETELEDLILRDGGPGETIYLSRINEAISLAEGEERHSLTLPITDQAATNTQIHTLGTVTFTDY